MCTAQARAWTAAIVVVVVVLTAVVLPVAHRFFSSQCFSRVVPDTPLHGLSACPELPAAAFSREVFTRDHQIPGVPLVVRGYATAWPAMAKWQDISFFGGEACHDFQIKAWGISLREYTSALSELERSHSAKQFSAMTELGEHYFKHNEELFYECPALFNDTLGFPLARSHASKPGTFAADVARWLVGLFAIERILPHDFVHGDWIQAVTWIGPPGSKTLLHYDDDPLSLLIQFRGAKHVRMWSSDQSASLYPHASCQNLNEYGTRFSRFSGNPLNMTMAEKNTFPLLSGAKYLDVIIRPGDMLFIPSGWWHFVSVWSGEGADGAGTSLSVAARSYSTCEGMSYLPSFIANWVHAAGLWDMTGFCVKPEGV
jgi:hypothetical protein